MTQDDWNSLLIRCEVKPGTARLWAPVFAECIGPGTFSKGNAEAAQFLGQVLHESAMLERLEEGLSYSAERLCQVWPRRFPTAASAAPYARNPEALANFVYGGRLGNTKLGDGYRYRGRGLLQVTGRDNYRQVGKALGIDLETFPDQMSEPDIALRSAIAWWNRNMPDSALGDIERVTRIVNGGTVGLAHRQKLTEGALDALA